MYACSGRYRSKYDVVVKGREVLGWREEGGGEEGVWGGEQSCFCIDCRLP